MKLQGIVDRILRLPSGYAVVGVRPGDLGLFGPRTEVLVPTLVLVRDGRPDVGGWLAIEARDLAETGAWGLPERVQWVAQRLVLMGEERLSVEAAGAPMDEPRGWTGMSASAVVPACWRFRLAVNVSGA